MYTQFHKLKVREEARNTTGNKVVMIRRFGNYVNTLPVGNIFVEAWIRENVIPTSALRVEENHRGELIYGNEEFPITMPYETLLTEALEKGYSFTKVENI